jgi:uncharacterized delta-60 repeat protein
VIIGGDFTTVSSTPRSRVARLEANGTLDSNFFPDPVAPGPVFAVAVQADGKVIIGGDFTFVGGTPRFRLARLHSNGMLDTSFDPGSGADATVYALALQPDGKLWVGGDFENIRGTNWNRIARLTADGALDPLFNPGTGANDSVYAIVLQPNGKALIGGDFTQVDGMPRHGIARLAGDVYELVVLPTSGFIGTSFNVVFSTQPGFFYVIEVSDDLATWIALRTNLADSATSSYLDPGAATQPWRFYRVRQVTP